MIRASYFLSNKKIEVFKSEKISTLRSHALKVANLIWKQLIFLQRLLQSVENGAGQVDGEKLFIGKDALGANNVSLQVQGRNSFEGSGLRPLEGSLCDTGAENAETGQGSKSCRTAGPEDLRTLGDASAGMQTGSSVL